jgi:heme O synthase-like polyprenyltransferase
LRRTTASARWLFAASIVYLPALLMLAFFDGGRA